MIPNSFFEDDIWKRRSDSTDRIVFFFFKVFAFPLLTMANREQSPGESAVVTKQQSSLSWIQVLHCICKSRFDSSISFLLSRKMDCFPMDWPSIRSYRGSGLGKAKVVLNCTLNSYSSYG